MEFKNPNAVRVFRTLSLYSLMGDLVVILSFYISLAFGYVNSGWGQVGWVVPLFLKLVFVLFFTVACSYSAFVLFVSKPEEPHFLYSIACATEFYFNEFIKSVIVREIIKFVSILSFIITLSIVMINFYFLFIAILVFALAYIVDKNKKIRQS